VALRRSSLVSFTFSRTKVPLLSVPCSLLPLPCSLLSYTVCPVFFVASPMFFVVIQCLSRVLCCLSRVLCCHTLSVPCSLLSYSVCPVFFVVIHCLSCVLCCHTVSVPCSLLSYSVGPVFFVVIHCLSRVLCFLPSIDLLAKVHLQLLLNVYSCLMFFLFGVFHLSVFNCLMLAAVPSPELVDRVRDLYQKRVSDVRFLIPVLNGLSKASYS